MRKEDLVVRVMQAQTEKQGAIFSGGVIDIAEEGYGFLRGGSFLPGPNDIYVSQTQIRRFALRTGDMITGQIRPPKDSEKYQSLLRVESVNDMDPEAAKRRPHFDTLTPIVPIEMIDLETTSDDLTERLIKLVAPIG